MNCNKFWFCEVKYAEAWEEDTMTLRENRFARIAELLGLPVEVIRAYGKPRTSGAFRRDRRLGTVVDTGQPSSRLMTLKGTEPQPAFVGVEEVAPSKTGEDELYAQWRHAPGADKPDLEEKLFNEVLKHDTAVIWGKLGESNHDLAHDIASDTIKNLGKFREQSKFSTWVQGIAKKKILHELRTRVRRRRVFDEQADYEKELGKRKLDASGDIEASILLEGIRRGLTSNEGLLLDAMIERLNTAEIAEKFGISEDAAESRQRLLRKKLIKKSHHRNGK